LSLQYLNTSINDLSISESFLDGASEFDGFNPTTTEALGWKVDKPSKFAVKGNSEHISETLGRMVYYKCSSHSKGHERKPNHHYC
jgi:hypothetical protein